MVNTMVDRSPYDAPLPDGSYDVVVFNVDDSFSPETHVIDLTVINGPERGYVLTLTVPSSMGTLVDLIGMPGTVAVTHGSPHLTIDR